MIRFPSHRISLLQEIDLDEEQYLMGFLQKLRVEKTDIKSSRLRKLHNRCFDVRFILHDIALIVMRINEDCKRVNRREELFDVATKQDRVWTSDEEDEVENLRYAVAYLNLDVRTLLVNITVFMDALSKFLSWTIKTDNQLSSKSFAHFKKDLEKYEGKEVQKIKHILIQKTQWFKEIKDLRDSFILHHAAARSGLEILDGETYIPLTTSKGGFPEGRIFNNAVAKTFKMKNLDGLLSDVKSLLKYLNSFLSGQIDKIPFEAKKI